MTDNIYYRKQVVDKDILTLNTAELHQIPDRDKPYSPLATLGKYSHSEEKHYNACIHIQ